MLIRADGDKYRHANTNFLWVKQGNTFANQTGLFHPLNPAPARRYRQPDFACDIGNRLGGIDL
jgi:hypothetical protein